MLCYSTDEDDFVLIPGGMIELTSLRVPHCVDFVVVNDDVREFNETATLTLTPGESIDQIAEGSFVTVIIVDDGDGKTQTITHNKIKSK